MYMRPSLFASSVSAREVRKEVMVVGAICALMYFVGFAVISMIHGISGSPFGPSAALASWFMGSVVACVFWFRGFSFQAVTCLTIGTVLQIRAEHSVDAGMAIPELVIGFLLFLRGFSFGPTRRR